jgi:hypothetical protein
MCVLRISGRDFDPSSADALAPYHVSRVGEPLRPSKPDGPRREESGVRVTVSDAPWSDLAAQARDACAFLDRHAETIRRLRDIGTAEDMRLDFPVNLRISEKVSAQFELLPAQLVERAGALGLSLEISIYPIGEDKEG